MHREIAARLLLVDLVKVLLRHREADENRLQLRDRDEAGRVGRPHHVAGIDQPHAEPAVDRGADIGKAEIEPGILDLRLIGLDRGLQLLHQRLLLVIGLPRLGPGREELAPAGEIGLRADELRLVLLLRRHRLVERGLERAGIDLDQRRAGLDVLAFGKGDLDDLAVDPALDRDHVERLDRADRIQEDRHVGGRDNAGGDRNPGRGRRRLGLGARRDGADEPRHHDRRQGEGHGRGDRGSSHGGVSRKR